MKREIWSKRKKKEKEIRKKKNENNLLGSRRVRPDSKFLRFAFMLDEEEGARVHRKRTLESPPTWVRRGHETCLSIPPPRNPSRPSIAGRSPVERRAAQTLRSCNPPRFFPHKNPHPHPHKPCPLPEAPRFPNKKSAREPRASRK